MVNKRQRGEGSSSSQAYDRRRFVSKAAAERFKDIMAARPIIPERGFDPGVLQGELWDMIRERRWQAFIAQPEPAVENIVREFYANAVEAQDNVVTVRGKAVVFSASVINEYYDLQHEHGPDDYTKYKLKDVNLADILQTLCRPDATWTFRGADALHFATSALSQYGKAWYYFICAKLMPTTHLSEIIKDRAILLYCLVTGKSINVGKVIYKSITSTIEGSSATGLPHPSLICGLCEQAGVTWTANETRQDPKVQLTERIITKLKHWEGLPMHPRGAGYIRAPLPTETPPPAEEDLGSGPSSSQGPSLTAALTENDFSIKLRRLQTQMDYQFIEISKQNAMIARRQDAMHSYNIDFNAALVAQFERLNPGSNDIQFPASQQLPAYPYAPPTPAPVPEETMDTDDE